MSDFITKLRITKAPEMMGMVLNKALEIFKEKNKLITLEKALEIAFGSIDQNVYDGLAQLKNYHEVRIAGLDGDKEY